MKYKQEGCLRVTVPAQSLHGFKAVHKLAVCLCVHMQGVESVHKGTLELSQAEQKLD